MSGRALCIPVAGFPVQGGLSAAPVVQPAAAPPVGRYTAAGAAIIAALVFGFGSWAALAPLSSAAVAPGIVRVDTNRKTVQHLDGGIIAELMVRDGDIVQAGEVLVRLDALESDADRDALQSALDSVMAQEARLLAQRDGRDEVAFAPELLARGSEAKVAEIVDGQRRIFATQAEAAESQVEVWRRRADQYRVQIASMQIMASFLDQQLALSQEELGNARQLLSKGFERRSRVLDLERRLAELQGDAAKAEGEIAMLGEQIAEADTQVKALHDQRAREVTEELREVQGQRVELDERLRKAGARSGRTEVVAPQDGVVMNLRYFAPGAVVPPGGAIVDVVPTGDQLVVEARVNPLDIDVVQPGLPATVRLIAFKQRTTPSLAGTVSRVSADALVQEQSGEVYFIATIEVPAEEMARASHVRLYPGMPASVSIVTGERTLLDYLYQPIAESFAGAFRED